MPLTSGTTEDENVACSHRLCLSVLRKHEPGDRSSWIPACAGMTDKCGNDMGVEFIQRPTGRPTLRPISGYFRGNDVYN